MAGSRIQDVILRGLRADQPDADTVSAGALYYVTDEAVIERSDGTVWEEFSDPNVGGITQLTGDVVAGPGAGSEPSVISNDAITTVKILDANVTLAKIEDVASPSFLGRITASPGVLQELTVSQATSMLEEMVGDAGAGGTKGLAPTPAAGDAAAGKFLKADGTYAVPPGGAGGAVLRAITCSVNDAAMTTGVVGEQTYVYEPGTIVGWYILANAAGDVEFLVEKTTFANYDASFASIVASAPPELVAAIKNSDTTLTGWTTAVAQFDVFRFTLVTADPDITRLNLVLVIQET